MTESLIELAGYFLWLGMDYDLYWNGEFDCVDSYIAKDELMKDVNRMNADMDAWLTGFYVMQAVGAVLDSKKNPYPREPVYAKALQAELETEPISPEENLARQWQSFKSCFK